MSWSDVEFVTATTCDYDDLNQMDTNAALLEEGARYLMVAEMDHVSRTKYRLNADPPQDGATIDFKLNIGSAVVYEFPTHTFN